MILGIFVLLCIYVCSELIFIMEVNRRYCTEIILGIRVFYLQKETELSGYPVLNACLGKNPTEKQNPTESFKGGEHLASPAMSKVSQEELWAFLKANVNMFSICRCGCITNALGS